jgi:hypothetical protein
LAKKKLVTNDAVKNNQNKKNNGLL